MPSSAHAVPSPRDRRQWLRLLSGACLAHVTASLGGPVKRASSTPRACPPCGPIDKQGRVAERYSGRIPAHAWDRIAELL